MPDRTKLAGTPSLTGRTRIMWVAAVPILLVLGGTVGYRVTEGWPLEDCIYMTVITLTTVGFAEVHPMTQGGRIFTMILALGGIFTLFWAATEVVRRIAHGEVQSLFGRQRMERRLAELTEHFVVCGLGRMGRLVCRQLESEGLPYTVIDPNQSALDHLEGVRGSVVCGDATRDEVLERAGTLRARGLIACASSDADNVLITMSARMLNDKLFIVARAEDEHTQAKLTRAGASRVVSPYAIGGQRLAQAMLRPNVVDFIDLATKTEHLDLQIEEVELDPKSDLVGLTLMSSGIRNKYGAIIVAVKDPDGSMVYNPGPAHELKAKHHLIVLAERAQLSRLVKAASLK